MTYKILVVDDEEDIHKITRMSLKKMKYKDQAVELHYVFSAKESIEFMWANPDTAVILMDVVMENDTAGLSAVQHIRDELDNDLTRIILRTGQPGVAPEIEVIKTYDIDGYLSKTEMTKTRLFSIIRTALKSYSQLLELQQHKDVFDTLNQSLLVLHQLDDIEDYLQMVVDVVANLIPSSLTVLYLALEQEDKTHEMVYYSGPEGLFADQLDEESTQLFERVKEQKKTLIEQAPCYFEGGYLIPLILLGPQGEGFIFVNQPTDSLLLKYTLSILSTHAALARHLKVENEVLNAL